MRRSLSPACLALALLAGTAGTAAAPSATAGAADATTATTAASGLPLGPAGLREHRTTTALAPGVTLTRIVRGAVDPADVWTVEVAVPAGGNPDPDAPATALSSRPDADRVAADLRGHGLAPRVEQVTTPATADYAPGTLGWRVRLGRYASADAAAAGVTAVHDAGYSGSAVFTGWDGSARDRGPWHLDVLTVDPHQYRGRLTASYGPDLERREPTSDLARAAEAVAAVNAGFFVLDPAAGAPGDPAGVGVYGGRVLSEATNDRPAFVLPASGRGATVTRLTWRGTVRGAHDHTLRLDGVDRVPGLIRNCGGTGDVPTDRPRHDTTCTDASELVRFTPEYGAATPAGPGVEAVLDASGRVTAVRSPRGGAVPAGGSTLQATGADATALRALAPVGTRIRVSAGLRTPRGAYHPSRDTSVVNGGPQLVRAGRVAATPRRDGMVHPGDPSFYYGWAHKRNPRTFAGVDGRGRVVLVTADGRSTASLGLSISETARVAHALGLREAMNLDGGGSTTAVVRGRVINDPSDATGERPVGDALLVSP